MDELNDTPNETFLEDLTFRDAMSATQVISALGISPRHLMNLRRLKRLNPVGMFANAHVYYRQDVERYRAARDVVKGVA